MGIKTDSKTVEDPKVPEECNVYNLYKLFASEEEKQALRERYHAGGMGYGEAKKLLLEKFNEYFEPYREKYKTHLKDESTLIDILKVGGDQARIQAEEVMERVRSKTGILRTYSPHKA